jgi:hypothetical protein
VNACDSGGQVALHVAALHGHELLVGGLLALHADPHARQPAPSTWFFLRGIFWIFSFYVHLNHPPFLNRQMKNRENFPAFANRFFVWNRGRAIRDGGMRNAMFF